MIPAPSIFRGAFPVILRVATAANPEDPHYLPDALLNPTKNVFDFVDSGSRVKNGEWGFTPQGGHGSTQPSQCVLSGP